MSFSFTVGLLLLITTPLVAQDLDPRAYAMVPVNGTIAISGFAYSHGEVVTDPTLPIQNVDARIQTASLGVARSFSLFKRTSQVLVALPYSWAQVSGEVGNQSQSITRSGLSDMRLRFSVLVLGAPATPLTEFKKVSRKTIVGVSLTAGIPTGQFFPDKLINLGTNRFSFKPELALSQPIGKRWLIDVYSGVWLFTTNHTFYPGNSVRSQEPIGAFQTHLSYNISPMMWLALDATYYVGGQSNINGTYSDDRLSNSRIGGTAVIQVGKRSSLKLAYSTGVVVRLGQNFSTMSVGYQASWFRVNNAKQ